MKKIFLFAIAVALAGSVMAQYTETLLLDATTHGTSRPGPGNVGMAILDDGGPSGEYTAGHDYWMTIQSNCDSFDTVGNRYLGVSFMDFDVGCRDTFYLYDGPSITSPLLLKRNNCFTTDSNDHFYVSASNTTGELTIRLRTVIRDSTEHYNGFRLSLACTAPCEFITTTIDTIFERTDPATGRVIGTGELKWTPNALDTIYAEIYDTVGTIGVDDTTWTYDTILQDSVIQQIYHHDSLLVDTIQLDSIIRIDTLGMVWAALLCYGQGVIFHGHGNYTYNTGYYHPCDTNVMFEWSLNDGIDHYNRKAATSVIYNGYATKDPSCTNVTLHIVDEFGCDSKVDQSVQVRISPNPIKTIFDLSSICSNDSLMVNVGYDGDNGTLTLKKIKFAQTVSKTNEVRTFIPDGPYCPIVCYEAPVDFTGEFSAGKILTDASEICSICMNYEHTYMGDYRLEIRCPIYDGNTSVTRGSAILKYGKIGPCDSCDPDAPDNSPDGRSAGSSTDAGFAPHVDGGTGEWCDSLYNPFGIGLDYCWSRNENYMLVTGDPADLPTRFQPGDWYISSSGNTITETVTLSQMASNYHRNNSPNPQNFQTRKPSNHEDKLDYYSPTSDFTDLIGCPLSGIWQAVICDYWRGDNGWIFNWSLDICGSASSADCDYQVGIDSVVWRPDTAATDFRDGMYKGERHHCRLYLVARH